MQGGCNCRYIRYRLGAPPIFVNGCHCRMCQRDSGSAFAINVMIEASHVEVVGGAEPETFSARVGAGPGTSGARCPRCAVLLWTTHGDFGEELLFVRAGTLDERVMPDAHFFVVTKHPLTVLPDDVPIFEGLPTSEDPPLWSEEAQRRVDAVSTPGRLPGR
jgi:hypothetical protein